MIRRDLLRLALTTCGLGLPASRPVWAAQSRALPDATPKHLPCWRRVQPPEQVHVPTTEAVRRARFRRYRRAWLRLRAVAARLPLLDRPGKPEGSQRAVLKEIDQAVEFGKKHAIHVQLNFHRARDSPWPSPLNRSRSGVTPRSWRSVPTGRPSPAISGPRTTR